MRLARVLVIFVLLVFAIAATIGGVILTKSVWRGWMLAWLTEEPPKQDDHEAKPRTTVELSPQAEKNLGIRTERARLETYWRQLSIPGQVVEMPGVSDRGITTPVAGVVTRVHRRPWEAVKPGDELFTIKINSEFLHASQAGLRTATKELEFTVKEIARVNPPNQPVVVPAVRLQELENQKQRQEVAIQGYRHQLGALGLTKEQISAAANGDFLTQIVLRVPETALNSPGLELQELKVTVGEQVTAGQLLAYVTDHQHLYIEGHAFKNELAHLEDGARGKSATDRPSIAVEWLDESQRIWDAAPESLQIRFFANVIDPKSQTFPFYIPLHNQNKEYSAAGLTHRIWRYRPGQRVRLHIPVEKCEDVLIVPTQGIVREGAETFAFRKNGDLFERVPVQVRHEDQRRVALVNDGSISPDQIIVLTGAAALNRALKLQGAEGGDEHDHHHH